MKWPRSIKFGISFKNEKNETATEGSYLYEKMFIYLKM